MKARVVCLRAQKTMITETLTPLQRGTGASMMS